MYTYSIIVTKSGQKINKNVDFLPFVDKFYFIECQFLLEVKNFGLKKADNTYFTDAAESPPPTNVFIFFWVK